MHAALRRSTVTSRHNDAEIPLGWGTTLAPDITCAKRQLPKQGARKLGRPQTNQLDPAVTLLPA
jgi:hypothetical protein